MSWSEPTQDQLDQSMTYGVEYALDEIANGNDGPQESPLSGEWADGLTPRKVAANVGYFHNLSAGSDEAYAEGESALCDVWEVGYNETWRNHLENLPVKHWLVTYTSMVIDARTASEAIDKAGDMKGGGNWEAEEVPL